MPIFFPKGVCDQKSGICLKASSHDRDLGKRLKMMKKSKVFYRFLVLKKHQIPITGI